MFMEDLTLPDDPVQLEALTVAGQYITYDTQSHYHKSDYDDMLHLLTNSTDDTETDLREWSPPRADDATGLALSSSRHEVSNTCLSDHVVSNRAIPDVIVPSCSVSANAFVQMEFPAETCKLLPDLPRSPGVGQIAALRVYAAGVRRAVIETDAEILDSADVQANAAAVADADKLELETWLKFKCIDRALRSSSRNTPRSSPAFLQRHAPLR